MSKYIPDTTYTIPAVLRKGKSVPKYRPSLTQIQLLRLETLVKQQATLPDFIGFSNTDLELLTILGKLTLKIQAGVQAAAYKAAPTVTDREKQQAAQAAQLEQLGGTAEDSETLGTADLSNLSKEEYWQHCYNLYIANPTDCTPAQIEAAMEHMYLNDLMSPEQLAAFEAASSNK